MLWCAHSYAAGDPSNGYDVAVFFLQAPGVANASVVKLDRSAVNQLTWDYRGDSFFPVFTAAARGCLQDTLYMFAMQTSTSMSSSCLTLYCALEGDVMPGNMCNCVLQVIS